MKRRQDGGARCSREVEDRLRTMMKMMVNGGNSWVESVAVRLRSRTGCGCCWVNDGLERWWTRLRCLCGCCNGGF